jgi:hypothetical protein
MAALEPMEPILKARLAMVDICMSNKITKE